MNVQLLQYSTSNPFRNGSSDLTGAQGEQSLVYPVPRGWASLERWTGQRAAGSRGSQSAKKTAREVGEDG